eukprot:scaffold422107_cov25-Prasinocladus_malaysianus.AAC.1
MIDGLLAWYIEAMLWTYMLWAKTQDTPDALTLYTQASAADSPLLGVCMCWFRSFILTCFTL